MIPYPRIEAYKFGEIIIDGIRYTNDVIIFPDRVMPDWWRESGHSLSLNDLDEVLKAQPEVLIIGIGAQGRVNIPSSTSQELEELGIGLIALPTDKACSEYEKLAQEGKVIAALHLTC
jgi:hypothetical protein